MKTKVLLSIGALAATGALLFGENKFSSYKTVLDNLQVKLEAVKNVRFNQSIIFDTDVIITNPTPNAIDIPGEKLTIKRLHFYSLSGKKLGTAETNLSKLEMPANGSRKIQNIPVTLSLSEITNNFSEVLDIVSDKNNLKISADIEAFGKQFTINS